MTIRLPNVKELFTARPKFSEKSLLSALLLTTEGESRGGQGWTNSR